MTFFSNVFPLVNRQPQCSGATGEGKGLWGGSACQTAHIKKKRCWGALFQLKRMKNSMDYVPLIEMQAYWCVCMLLHVLAPRPKIGKYKWGTHPHPQTNYFCFIFVLFFMNVFIRFCFSLQHSRPPVIRYAMTVGGKDIEMHLEKNKYVSQFFFWFTIWQVKQLSCHKLSQNHKTYPACFYVFDQICLVCIMNAL